jgi:type II secretory pathway pseudopilin PulG
MTITKLETSALIFFLGLIMFATIINLQNSFRKSRDAQRQGDVQTVANALEVYFKDMGEYPASDNGKIVGCGPVKARTTCEWGEVFHEEYLRNLPRDPQFADGGSYRYVSDGKRFQLYASLESMSEPEFSKKIIALSISCGNKICNFGRASGNTPLDKTLSQYENELIEQQKKKK